MKKQNIKFFENFIAAFGGSIGFLIALQAKGLDYLKNYQDFIMWILILLIFIAFALILKFLELQKMRDFMDGVWSSFVIYTWTQIIFLPFQTKPIQALLSSFIYIILGVIIYRLGESKFLRINK